MAWTLAGPITSSFAPGAVVPMPILAVDPVSVCDTAEFWMLVEVVHSGRAFTVPPEVVTVEGFPNSLSSPPSSEVSERYHLAATRGAVYTDFQSIHKDVNAT